MRLLPSVFLLAGALSHAAGSAAAEPTTTLAPAIVDEIRSVFAERSVFPADPEKLDSLDAGNLEERLREIDPDARVFRPGDYRPHWQDRGPWTGIGAELALQGENVWLIPYQGGSAARAGLPERARLLMVDGEPVGQLPPEELFARLRGEAGTSVRIAVAGPDGKLLERELPRELQRPLQVELAGNGGQRVIRIREFVARLTRPALLATVSALEESARASGGALEGLVIDLRDCPGGDLFEAVDMAALFVPAGSPLAVLREREGRELAMNAPGGARLTMPVILLIGPDTASAAEIFAGILQRHGRAVLVGQITRGKCTTQTDQRLADGSVLRFTNREVWLPGGKRCSDVGIVPDIPVPDAVLADLNRLALLAREALGMTED